MMPNFFSRKISIQDSALVICVVALFVAAFFSFGLDKYSSNYYTGAITNNDLTSGLIAYYPFDKDANDYSGNARNGINNGATPMTGIKGGAYYFSPSKNIDLRSASSLSGTIFTISVWIKTGSTKTERVALAQRGQGYNGAVLRVSNGKVAFFTFNGDYGINFESDLLINDNQWHNIAVRSEGSKGQLFMDGVLQRSMDVTNQVNLSNTQVVSIGSDIVYSPSESFEGIMDELYIYNRALTDSEIGSLFNYNNQACLDKDGDGYGVLGSISCPKGNQLDCNDASSNINPGINTSSEIECDGIDHNCDGKITCLACVVKSAPALFYAQGYDNYTACQKSSLFSYVGSEFSPAKKFKKMEWIFNWDKVPPISQLGIYQSFQFYFENSPRDSAGNPQDGYMGPQIMMYKNLFDKYGPKYYQKFLFSIWRDPMTTEASVLPYYDSETKDECWTVTNGGEGSHGSCEINNIPDDVGLASPGKFVNQIFIENHKYRVSLENEKDLPGWTVWKLSYQDLTTSASPVLVGKLKLKDRPSANGGTTKGYGLLTAGSGFFENPYAGDDIEKCLKADYTSFTRIGPIGYDVNGVPWIPHKGTGSMSACYRSLISSSKPGVTLVQGGRGISRAVNIQSTTGNQDWWEIKTLWDLPQDQVCNMNGKCENLGGNQETASSCPSDCASIQTGTISATSNPVGANVYVDNVLKGTTSSTPLIITGVAPGARSIKFTKAGYLDTNVAVTIGAGQTSTVTVALTQLTGTISATSNPVGANVYVDNVLKGTTSSTPLIITGVVPGSHSAKFTKVGYSDANIAVPTVVAGQTSMVSAKLVQLSGAISATSTPVGAQVYVDGVLKGTTGTTPLTISGVAIGAHAVLFSKMGYSSVTLTTTVSAGGTSVVSATLQLPGTVYAVSTPMGAQVYVDRIYMGVTGITPLIITGLMPGTHSFIFYKPGYAISTKNVTILVPSVFGGQVPTVSAVLTLLPMR